jgi:hypothetical protein
MFFSFNLDMKEVNDLRYKIALVLRNNLFRGLYYHIRRHFIKMPKNHELPYSINCINWFSLKETSVYDKYFSKNPEKKKLLLKLADDFLNGEVLVYNRKIKLYEYSIDCYSERRLDNDVVHQDLRFYWEIYRDRFVYNICLAYFITKNEAYATKLLDYVKDWKKFTPLKSDNIPYNGMESAIKIMNLSWILFFLENNLKNDNEANKCIRENIFFHASHIYKNYDITIYGLESNHGLSCSIGLIYASLLFPNYKNAAKWQKLGKKTLLRGLKNQFSSDGVNFESSVHYHRFVFEMLVFIFAVLSNNKHKLAYQIKPDLRRIGNSLVGLQHGNHMISRFGDNDGGRFLPGFNTVEEFNNLSFLNDFIDAKKESYNYETLIFAGVEGINSLLQLPEKTKYGNYLSIKSNNVSLIASASIIGTNGKGNHQHNDFTSLEIFGTVPFIVDPWTYCYTGNSELRNKDRKTSSHNAVLIDNREIVEFKEKDLFEFQGKIKINSSVSTRNNVITGKITHFGYKNLKRGKQLVSRTFIVDTIKDQIAIIDELTGVGDHCASITLLIPTKYWSCKKDSNGFIFSNNKETFELWSNWELKLFTKSTISSFFLNSEDAYCIQLNSNYSNSKTGKIVLTHKLK